jgi:hypothetical protein
MRRKLTPQKRDQSIAELEHQLAEPLEQVIARAEQAAMPAERVIVRTFSAEEQDRWDMLNAELNALDQRIAALSRLDGLVAAYRVSARLRERRLATWTEMKLLVECAELGRS